jgi:hypothetical protein
MPDWNEILADPRFQGLNNKKKMSVARNFFNEFYSKDKRYTALDKRKQDKIKKKFYDTATATLETAPEKSARQMGLERIAQVGTEAMRGGEATAPISAMSQLAGETLGFDIHDRMTREEAEAALTKGQYGKYARGSVGNVTKGMASVPELLMNAPVAITEALAKGAAKATAPGVGEIDRTEAVGEAASGVASELFGWIKDIADDPIRFAFERPEDVAFALEMGKAGIKGTVKGIDVVEGIKARKGAIESIRESFKEPKVPAKKAPAKKPAKMPTPIKSDIFPDPVKEGGFVKVPKVEDIANTAKWMKDNAKNTYRSIKEFFMPLSTIKNSEMFLKLRYKHLGDLDRLESSVLREHKKLSELTPEENLRVFKYLDGEIPLESLEGKAKEYGKRIRRMSDKAWNGYLNREIIDLNTYEKHKGNYVKYMYLKHLVKDKGDIPGTLSGKLDLSQLKARMDLTPEQRKAIGWVEDASIAGPVGVAQSFGDLMKYDYLKKISENPDWVWEPSVVDVKTNMVNKRGERITKKMSIYELREEVDTAKKVSERVPDNVEAKTYYSKLKKKLESVEKARGEAPKDYYQLPDNPKYGPLRGAFVRKPIAQDLMPVMSITGDSMASSIVKGAIDVNQKLMSAFKVGKVALNPPTIIRNVGSNIVQQNMSGVPIWEMPTHLSKGLKHIAKKDKIFGQAKRHGIFKTNWGQAEIGEILGDLKKLEKKPYPNLLAGLQKIAEQYGKIDDFFKMAKFAERVRKGDSYAKAAIEAQKWAMDYSLASPAIKAARANVAPFITYQYKVLPLIAETARKRPWVFAKYAAIPWMATEALLEKEGITDEEWAELKKDLPIYLRNSGTAMPVPWRSPEGNIQWVNYEYFMPFGNAMTLAEDVPQIGEVSPKGTGPGDLLRAVGIGNPIADTVYGTLLMARGTDPPKDTFTKRPIYNRLDDPSTKLKKTMYWLYTKWAPGAFHWKEPGAGALGKTMRIGEQDKYGRTVTPSQAGAMWFGINITAPTPGQAARYRSFFVGELKREMRKVLTDPTSTDEEKQEVQENFQKMMEELDK